MVNLPRLLADPYVERRVKQQVHMQRILVQKKKFTAKNMISTLRNFLTTT